MKNVTFLNCLRESQQKVAIDRLVNRAKVKYRNNFKITSAYPDSFIPNVKRMRLFTIFSTRIKTLHGIRRIINSVKLKTDIDSVLILYLENNYFPVRFSISRFCLQCEKIIDYYTSGIETNRMYCKCQHGSEINIFHFENYDDYFLLN